MAHIVIADTLAYVTGDPEVEYGENGNLLLHFPTGDDFGLVTLSFRTDEAFQLALDALRVGYDQARDAKARSTYPSLWIGTPE